MLASKLAWGVCAGPSGKFDAIAEPALRKIDPDATILARRDAASIAQAYNQFIDRIAGLDVAGLVLIHDDLEITDPDAVEKLTRALDEPDVAIVGVIGGRDLSDMPWWTGRELVGHAPDTHWVQTNNRLSGDVDAVDGILLALSPWAIRNLRFDDRYPAWHGYDADICRQARVAGKRVVVVDIEVFHHTSAASPPAGVYPQAVRTWRLKWLDAGPARRLFWRASRLAYALRR